MLVRRYERQARLAEIGAEGQERLAQAEVSVTSPGIGGEIEALYLLAAGLRNVRLDGARDSGPFSSFGVVDPAARDFARGAHAALRAVREIVLRGAT